MAVFWKPMADNKTMVFETAVPIILKYIELYHLWRKYSGLVQEPRFLGISTDPERGGPGG
jgi:hypothetical protein